MKTNQSVTLVTGGASGLGLCIAHALFNNGATVVVFDRNPQTLNELPAEFYRYCVDVTDVDQVQTAVASVVHQFGKIDVLVNNAGVIFSEPFVNIMNPTQMMHDYGRFRDHLRINLDSVFIMTAAVVEQMVKRRTKGVIVNISSISAQGNAGQTAYSAAKAAVNAMTVTWSKELGRMGIRCNAVAPGFMATESTKHALSETIIAQLKASTPLRRLGNADEVAHTVLFLIENDYMNGAIIGVNGGLTI